MGTDKVWWEIVYIETNVGYPHLRFDDEDDANMEAANMNSTGGFVMVCKVVNGERIQ